MRVAISKWWRLVTEALQETRQGSFKDPVVPYGLSGATTWPRSMMEDVRGKGLIDGQASF